jgi:hypothetical protein
VVCTATLDTLFTQLQGCCHAAARCCPAAVVDNSPCLAHFKANGMNQGELK